MFKYRQIVLVVRPKYRIRNYSKNKVNAFQSKIINDSLIDNESTNDITPPSQTQSGILSTAFNALHTIHDDTDKELLVKTEKNKVSNNQDNNKIKKENEELSASGLLQLINKAKDVDTLLKIAERPNVYRWHALKVLAVLSYWMSINKVKFSDFETDTRYIKLYNLLGKDQIPKGNIPNEVQTVMAITGEDEAASLIENLTVPQMIKVMQALQHKGRRSITVIRAIGYNILKRPDVIDLKRSADLLFCMTALNYTDTVLLEKICKDVMECLPGNKDKVVVVSSIVRSLGLLRYRDEDVLAALVGWLVARRDLLQPKQLCSALHTLSILNYLPPNCEDIFEISRPLQENDMPTASSWLEFVFSLLIFDKVERSHLESTLKPEFTDRLMSIGEIPIIARRKLMTIDACARLKYPDGVRLAEDVTVGVPIVYTKQKEAFVKCVLDTFNSLVSAKTFMKKHCETDMGFIYDAEFAINSKCHPVPLEKADAEEIAVQCLDYHDMTTGSTVPLGFNQLYSRLLQQKGYKVLKIPYTEFNPRDKLVTRVKYIENELKKLVK